MQDIHAQLAPSLQARGYSAEQIDQLSAATLAHLGRHTALGDAQGIHVSKDGSRIAVRHEHHQLSELDVGDALQQSTGEHLQAAARQGQARGATPSGRRTQQPAVRQRPAPTEQTAAVHR